MCEPTTVMVTRHRQRVRTLAGIAGGGGCNRSGRASRRFVPVLPGARILRFRPRHDRRADGHMRGQAGRGGTEGRRRYPCPCRVWITGRAPPGTIPGESSSASDIFPAANCHRNGHCWCILRQTLCCTTSRRKSSGQLWALTGAGGMECGWCFASGRETWR